MDAYRDAVFESRFQEDLDISEPQVLVALGEKVGLNGKALEEALARETYAAELDNLRRQGENLGVTGIPTYILNGQTFWGADPTDDVLESFHGSMKG
jgi:2-hydroxychromene-2-carboxylate isomerase